ncbi:hypothetical protein F2Q68_00021773 [Brassica cretica]|uniref:Uncharacterized protein n=1 Tax=Brassica cretica TaxID=69181 RepID=A0A8S9G1I2_BRACR|nr:hypothetical protein F2Q68_00021773 [Brassica cretica]
MSGSMDFGVASHTSLSDSPVAHPSLFPFSGGDGVTVYLIGDSFCRYADESGSWEARRKAVMVLSAFDPKQSCWSVVNGLDEYLAVETAQSKWSKAAECGEKKMALLFPKKHDGNEVICCADIAFERRQGVEVWGIMESCDVVFEDGLFDMVKCASVTV